MKVINLFGGPGTGKSTTAAALFAEMKHRGYKVELVTEYAKELCYEQAPHPFDQYQILTEQDRRQQRLLKHVDYVVTDAPLILGLVYGAKDMLARTVKACFDDYDNFNVFLRRVKPYANYGRHQSEDEAREIDGRIRELPITFHLTLDADRDAHLQILRHIEQLERIEQL